MIYNNKSHMHKVPKKKKAYFSLGRGFRTAKSNGKQLSCFQFEQRFTGT